MKIFKISSLLMILIIIAGCGQQVESPSSGQPLVLQFVPVQILISEVLTGVEGNNQADYIELYNPGTETADLNG